MNSPTSEKSLIDLSAQLEQYDLHTDDGHTVCWNKHNKDHPRNWSFWAKAYTAIVISWLELFMTGISSSGVRITFFPISSLVS